MFDVGQKVICVRKEPWRRVGIGVGRPPSCPSFGDECTIDRVLRKGEVIQIGSHILKLSGDVVGLVEYGEPGSSIFDARWFRPKEPNIEALRSLLVSKKQSEKV